MRTSWRLGAGVSTWAVRRGYLRHLRREIAPRLQGELREIEAAIVAASRKLVADNEELITDRPAAVHVTVAAHVLASYRVLAPRFEDRGELIALLGWALAAAYRPLVGSPLALALRVVPDAFRLFARMVGARSFHRRLFGEGFAFDSRQRPGEIDLVVGRCLYHGFFVRNGAPELTTIICESDRAWIDVLRPGRDGVRFERPSTIGRGGAECIFRFRRIDPPAG